MLKQGHWFARSGSVVTIVAIYFASLKLQDRVDRAPAVAKVYFERKRQRVSEDLLLGGMDQSVVESFLKRLEDDMDEEIGGHAMAIKRRLLLVETGIFILGTIIWGFGDLPLDALFRMGKCQ